MASEEVTWLYLATKADFEIGYFLLKAKQLVHTTIITGPYHQVQV